LRQTWSRNRSAPRRFCFRRGPPLPGEPWPNCFFAIITGSACLPSGEKGACLSHRTSGYAPAVRGCPAGLRTARNLEALARDPDFLVLDEAAARAPRLEKAFIAGAIMLAVLLSAILGFVPIAIAGLTGAALMVLVGCLSMEEAYRAIEWKVVFPHRQHAAAGCGHRNTGVAQMGATALIAAVGDFGLAGWWPRSLRSPCSARRSSPPRHWWC
jgi:hypothetical protein